MSLLLRSLLVGCLAVQQVIAQAYYDQPGPNSPCEGNTDKTRKEWCDYSIDTDYWVEPVDTGVTREYWLEITDVIVAPDGVPRAAAAINGTIPGPTIIADWGDTVVVHLTNHLTTTLDGASFHWHGIRQNYTNSEDGVPSITQCPLPINDTMTYTWKATQYGSTWYHSHFALQAWMGVFGGIIINGPASENYDVDLGMVFLNDWHNKTVNELYPEAERNGPPMAVNGLINGTNVRGSDDDPNQTGSRFNVTFEPGTSYRMRLVDAAIDTHWKFSIDNHTLTVIAVDLVPIKPYKTKYVNLGMGQRYDVIVTADQADVADSFWMRATPQGPCSSGHDQKDNIKGIVYYGDSTSTPSTTGYSYTEGCDDETANIVPYVPRDVGPPGQQDLVDVTANKTTGDVPVFKWYLNSTTMLVDWGNSTLGQILDGVTDFERDDAVFVLDGNNTWVYFIIETNMGIPHPIHLHGHDFHILSQGLGRYSTNTTLNLKNPPRRDTAMLPSKGYLVMAWETDNPGAWLAHCHIGWHTSEGFAVQFLERVDEIPGISQEAYHDRICKDWNAFELEHGIVQHDSGV